MHVGKLTNFRDCEKELEKALQRIVDLEARIADKDELIAVLKERLIERA
ncbi:hypothetical protein [Xanthocytophaga agilis]|uniref:Uncharacterized protein n=1 Tax=Xanthocytophaga agilis TaxID=3048010 RepID=A0AAE3R8L4_9BACT|nr:hypothetical protein [Xanthocytophaga agilis]MDJ1502748.1 hypothetical protein [Xanthocytophaga agilis]